MSRNFVKFLGLVSKDAGLQARLNSTDSADGFSTTAVALGREHGLQFTAAEVRAAMDALASGVRTSGDVSDAILADVAGMRESTNLGCKQPFELTGTCGRQIRI